MFNWLPALLLLLAQSAMHQGGTEVRVNQWLSAVTTQVTQEQQHLNPPAPKVTSRREVRLAVEDIPMWTAPAVCAGWSRAIGVALTRACPLRAGPGI